VKSCDASSQALTLAELATGLSLSCSASYTAHSRQFLFCARLTITWCFVATIYREIFGRAIGHFWRQVSEFPGIFANFYKSSNISERAGTGRLTAYSRALMADLN
jgi:hypothetical protein